MTDLLDRINALDTQLRRLEAELADLRREAALASTPSITPEPPPPAVPSRGHERPPVYATPAAPAAPTPSPKAPPPQAPPTPVYTTAAAPAPPTPRPQAPSAPVYATRSAPAAGRVTPDTAQVPATPKPAAPTAPPPPPRPPRFQMPDIDLAMFTGPRALAWVGGVVTLLGIVFFFVLAVNRGWVSAELRVALGALVSVGLYAAAWWIYRRLGALEGALAAAGTGIAGAYATLLAATALYDLVPTPVALLISAGIAAVGIATALAWNAQITAVLGLVGAMLGPEMIEAGDPSALGSVYVAIVFVAAVVVALRRGWFETLAVAGAMCFVESSMLLIARNAGVSALAAVLGGMFALLYLATGLGAQRRPASASKTALLRGDALPTGFFALSGVTAFGLIVQPDPLSVPAGSVAVFAVLWLSYFAAGLGLQIRSQSGLSRIPTSLVLFSVSYAFLATYFCFDKDAVGWALLVVAAVTAAPVLFFLRLKGQRDFVTVLWAAALSVLAVAVGNLLGGDGLVLAWAAQGALLAWVAVLTRELRLQLAAIGYLALAIGYTVLYEAAAPIDLFRETSSPESGITALVFISLGTAAFALAARAGRFRPQEGVLVAAVVSALSALYAASFGLLAILEFEQAEVAMTALWAAVGSAFVVAGLLRGSRQLYAGGLVLFGAAVAKLLFFDLIELTTDHGAWSLFIVGAFALAVGYAEGLYGERMLPFVDSKVRLTYLPILFLPASAVAMSIALSRLLDHSTAGINHQGAALLGLAAVYVGLAATVFGLPGRRDLATMLWALGAVIAAVGFAEHLLDGSALVLAWAAMGAAIAWITVATREQRLQLAAIGYLGLALGYTLYYRAPPEDLFRVTASPESGIPAILFVSAGAAAFALAARAGRFRPQEGVLAATALGAIGVLYAASFGLLATLDFWVAEVAITGLWAAVGFAVVLAGLLRTSARLHWAGIALYAAAVAKLIWFDLPTLTRHQDAWSLLIVGAFTLAIGYAEGLYGERLLTVVDSKVRLTPLSFVLLPASAYAMTVGLMRLLDDSTLDIDQQGAALVGLGAVYGVLASTVFGRPGRRDLATMLWALGALVAAYGFAEHLLGGSALILAWAALGGALAGLGRVTRDERFFVGSAALVGAALLQALDNTPPASLFEKSAHPAAGLAGVVFAGLGLAALTACIAKPELRRIGAWATGAIALYAGSLAILGLFEWPAANNPDAVAAAFQRGHTGVSAAWGLVGLALLVVGLRRNERWIRLGGVALFVLALAKIFLYDLQNLTQLARAFSFLAVGVVLLVAALVYQRLTEDRPSSTGTAPPG